MAEQKTEGTILERLYNAGAHFGFTKQRRHPSVVPYLFGNKSGTDLFDLEKTAEKLEEAKRALYTMGKEGKTVLFVGTKSEASNIVRAHAERAESPYVTNRWIGGMMTNFSEIKKRIARLRQLIEEGEKGELDRKYTKRERVVIGREVEKLRFNFGGIIDVDRLPHMLLIVDPRHDSIAMEEARELSIPIVGVMSSDNDMTKVTYPVLVNDALKSSLTLALDELTAAYEKGKSERPEKSAQSGPKR